MFNVLIDDSLLAKLNDMLQDEDEGACIRLREYKLGAACRTRIILGLGVDEPVEDEDEEMEIRGVPFIAESDFLHRYGREFKVNFSDDGQMVVEALGQSTN